MKTYLIYISTALLLWVSSLSAETYLESRDFIEQVLGENSIQKVLWVSSDLRKELKESLGDNISAARVRYWQSSPVSNETKSDNAKKTIWVLDKIGRDKPITVGIVIENQKIERLEILAFRESRGYEVKYPRFTNQFSGLFLSKKIELNARVDNITGATLSVNAVKKTARLALFLQSQLDGKDL